MTTKKILVTAVSSQENQYQLLSILTSAGAGRQRTKETTAESTGRMTYHSSSLTFVNQTQSTKALISTNT